MIDEGWSAEREEFLSRFRFFIFQAFMATTCLALLAPVCMAGNLQAAPAGTSAAPTDPGSQAPAPQDPAAQDPGAPAPAATAPAAQTPTAPPVASPQAAPL